MGAFEFQGVSNMRKRWEGCLTLTLLGTCVLLTSLSLLRELKQGISHWVKGSKWGAHYLWDFWNVVELLSYSLLFLGIPLMLLSENSDNNRWLTGVIAVESILLWWKLLYYLQPLPIVGPVVIAIGGIIASTFIFLLLAAFVLVGFTMAFYVLCR